MVLRIRPFRSISGYGFADSCVFCSDVELCWSPVPPPLPSGGPGLNRSGPTAGLPLARVSAFASRWGTNCSEKPAMKHQTNRSARSRPDRGIAGPDAEGAFAGWLPALAGWLAEVSAAGGPAGLG